MEIFESQTTYFDNLKRYWRRRKYRKLSGSRTIKRKMKYARLGDGTSPSPSPRRSWKIRTFPKLRLRLVSPLKLFAKFHEAYVDMMIGLAGNVAKSSRLGIFSGKKVASEKHISMVSSGEELVDSKLVLEIYNRLAASRQLAITAA
ncbi:uncharacterized protein LOC107413320 [Ziziphus jujuba]|uniref:Uncharacterized protein LOC107413320 n=2 Tax=Ziziphus jujuba TaxID=326968 RepID=A0A6P3ZN45_ZIZJJ|nr:uncharacterized protein LOC107413320 [Ziziphus jujuba]KAH7516461.1 hypothetical protein FEM48_Zijuj10G0137600 [Ziziphus jujuba var. spinosa]